MGSEQETHRAGWAGNTGDAGGSGSLGGLAECRAGPISPVGLACGCNLVSGTVAGEGGIAFHEHAAFWGYVFSLLLRVQWGVWGGVVSWEHTRM